MTGPSEPIPMLLWCPQCGRRHVDAGVFATKPHHTHACQGCGMTWRPAIVPTVGVQFLPGFRDVSPEVAEVAQQVGEMEARVQRLGGLVEVLEKVAAPKSGTGTPPEPWDPHAFRSEDGTSACGLCGHIRSSPKHHIGVAP